MWETLFLELLKLYGPQLLAWAQQFIEQNGRWPTKEEVELKVISLADEIKKVGEDFLNRGEVPNVDTTRTPEDVRGDSVPSNGGEANS